MKPKLLFAAAMLACLSTTEARLFACTCAGTPSPCTAAQGADAVFVAQVIDIAAVNRNAEADVPMGPYSRRVSFKITETLRGALKNEETVVVYTGSGGGDCGYPFSKGRSYLIYAHRVETRQLVTTSCSRTREASRGADGEIKELRALGPEPRKCRQP